MPQLLREIDNLEQDNGGGGDNVMSPKDRYVALLAEIKREWISNDVIPDIREFLKKNEPGESDILEDPMKYEYWVQTSIRFGIEPPVNEAAAMVDFIFELNDPFRASALLSVIKDEVLEEFIHDKRLHSFMEELQSALQEQRDNMTASKRKLIREGLDNVNRLLNQRRLTNPPW